MSAKKDAKIAEAYRLTKQYPDSSSRILDRLLNAKTFTVTIDEFNEYGRFMVSQNVVEPHSIVDEYPDIPGFTQSDKYSDSEVLKIFEDRDSLQAVLNEIGSPPTDAEWFQAGKTADQRIAELKPFYDTRIAEEWKGLTDAVDMPFLGDAGMMGPIQGLTQLIAGWTDLRYDFKEDLHERGIKFPWDEGASFNPLTGFGAWEMAEFQRNPITGQQGFSPELIEMEDELEQLYGDKREFMDQIEEGGYSETLPGSETMVGIDKLNQMIREEQLLDPRMFGEAQ